MPLPPSALSLLQKHWGFSSLRPLQSDAIAAHLARRDSLDALLVASEVIAMWN